MQRVSPVVAAPWDASFFATISASKKSLYAAEQHRADVARSRPPNVSTRSPTQPVSGRARRRVVLCNLRIMKRNVRDKLLKVSPRSTWKSIKKKGRNRYTFITKKTWRKWVKGVWFLPRTRV